MKKVDAHRKNIRAQQLSLVVGISLLTVKFLAWWLTKSNAILTDAVESIVNVVGASFGLYAVYLATLPKDDNHPYGHGKIEFVSASVEGSMIFLAGVLMVAKAIYNWFVPVEVSQLGWGIVLVAIAGAINFLLGIYLQKRGEQEDSLALEASGRHLITDGWSTVGLLIGLIVFYFYPAQWVDSVLAIIFGLFIAFNGYSILRKSMAGIMDEADTQLINGLVKVLSKHRRDQWIDIHNFRVVKYGAQLHIDAHLSLPFYFTVEQMHDEVELLNQLVDHHCGKSVEMFVHVDPCIPAACQSCSLITCTERKSPFKAKIDWNMELITKNQKHVLQLDHP